MQTNAPGETPADMMGTHPEARHTYDEYRGSVESLNLLKLEEQKQAQTKDDNMNVDEFMDDIEKVMRESIHGGLVIDSNASAFDKSEDGTRRNQAKRPNILERDNLDDLDIDNLDDPSKPLYNPISPKSPK